MDNTAEQLSEVDSVISSLNEVQEDATVPRNVRSKIQNINNTLKANTETSIKVNKALNELSEIANDINLQSYTRTQIWNAITLLEKLH